MIILTEAESKRLLEIEQRADQATPGPWEESTRRMNDLMSDVISVHGDRRMKDGWKPEDLWDYCVKRRLKIKRDDDHNWLGLIFGIREGQIDSTKRYFPKPKREDLEFIAAAREDVPWLIKMIRMLSSQGGRQ